MGRILGFAFLCLLLITAIVAARSVAVTGLSEGPLVFQTHADNRIWTPLSTVKDERRTLANRIGGRKLFYSQVGEGFEYEEGYTRGKPVTFIVPKGALVDTKKGIRWEGERVSAKHFYIWWP
jgi:hypothetical protein